MEPELIAFKNWLCERYDLSIPNNIVREYLSGRDSKSKPCYNKKCIIITLNETCGLGNINCQTRIINMSDAD